MYVCMYVCMYIAMPNIRESVSIESRIRGIVSISAPSIPQDAISTWRGGNIEANNSLSLSLSLLARSLARSVSLPKGRQRPLHVRATSGGRVLKSVLLALILKRRR